MGDIIDALKEEGHLSRRQHQAGVLLLRDLRAYHGQSDGLVGQTAEKVDSGSRARLWPPGGPCIVALDARLNRLRPHERRLMAWLIRQRELPRGMLRDLGRDVSGYTDRIPARAVAVGRIGALLDTLADDYLGVDGA